MITWIFNNSKTTPRIQNITEKEFKQRIKCWTSNLPGCWCYSCVVELYSRSDQPKKFSTQDKHCISKPFQRAHKKCSYQQQLHPPPPLPLPTEAVPVDHLHPDLPSPGHIVVTFVVLFVVLAVHTGSVVDGPRLLVNNKRKGAADACVGVGGVGTFSGGVEGEGARVCTMHTSTSTYKYIQV